MPAESYPRYSRRRNASRSPGATVSLAMIPIIPHIEFPSLPPIGLVLPSGNTANRVRVSTKHLPGAVNSLTETASPSFRGEPYIFLEKILRVIYSQGLIPQFRAPLG